MRRVTVRNLTRAADLACAEWRGSVLGRTRGLLGRASLAAGDGIVISPCSSIHMMFMRFPIDALYLDRDLRVVKVVDTLKPYRMSVGGKGAHITVELASGALAGSGTRVGDQLAFLAFIEG